MADRERDQSQQASRTSLGSAGQSLTSVSGLTSVAGAAQICAYKVTGADPSIPIGVAG